MPKTKLIFYAASLMVWALAVCLLPVQGAEIKSLSGHVPEITRHLPPTGRLAATNELHLAIGLPLHNAAKLEALIRDLSNPSSPNYRHYLTPQEFTAQFGATAAEYAALKKFAQMNGFKISRTHDGRTLLNVTARAADVERAFHLKLKKFKHPTEAREFFAPDAEPTVDAGLAVADIQGLSDYSRPRPKLAKRPLTRQSPRNGSGPDGYSYFGDDFRNAYAPGTTLTGAGQRVGLLQFDGFHANDIAAYAASAGGGRVGIPLETVSVDGFNGIPSGNGGDVEVSLDIEMAMAMAPGLDKIVVFEANPTTGDPNTLLTAMAARTDISQFSCSWGWSGGPNITTENCFKQFIVQGQSFFNASGDSDAFTTGAGTINGVDNPGLNNSPSSSPYITSVGGTTLTMNGTGASYASERVWNWGSSGSSGGISSYYAIPIWQSGISMAASGGSDSYRNTPDVAMTADNVYVVSGGGGTGAGGIGGTSCAAPLWAGFMALANQQAAAAGQPALGFINPAIYALAAKSSYSTTFNDVTTGDNISPNSPSAFYAVPGYDLATGLGTPNGTNLINALLNPDSLSITPAGAVSIIRSPDGSFNQTDQTYSLTNTGTNALSWSLVNTCAWLNVSSVGGFLGMGSSDFVVVSLNTVASNLTAGAYSATLVFSNLTSGIEQTHLVTLQIMDSLLILPTNNFSFSGASGALLTPSAQTLTLTNAGTGPLSWSLNNTSAWFTVSPASGNLPAQTATNITFALTASASNLANGIFTSVFVVTNVTGHSVQWITNRLIIGQPLVQNGGFESGAHDPWILTETTGPDQVVNGNGSSFYPYDGTYAFGFGQANTPAHLSQDLATTPGQTYLLSFWLVNPTGSSGSLYEQFQVNWNGTTVTNLDNPSSFVWQNMSFVLTATGAVTTLEFVVRNDPDYFGLDDVSVTPVFAPSLSAQPTNLVVDSRGNAAFSAVAAGTDPLVYQWYKDGTRLFDGPGVFGVATTNLALTRVLAADAGNYWLVVTNAYGAVTSSVAVLTVSASDVLVVAPDQDFSVSGVGGGPFAGLPQTFFLTNSGGAPLSWSLLNTSSWLNASSSQGVLAAGANTNVTVSLAGAASQLPAGTYAAVIQFSNQTSSVTQPRAFNLLISTALTLSPSAGFIANGPPGGPFDVTNQVFALTNLGLSSQSWGVVNTSAWLTASASAGSVAASTNTAFTLGLSPAANSLVEGVYTATVLMTNTAGSSFALPFTLRIGQTLIDNGGFETGDFTSWSLAGNGVIGNTSYNTVASNPSFVHSGTYGAFLGDVALATLSQSFRTVPGQTYLLSGWFNNLQAGAEQQFLINWNTNAALTNQLFFITNPPVLPWTNFTYVVKASGTNATLQFGAENVPNGFALDDVRVIPVSSPQFLIQPTNLTLSAAASATFSASAAGSGPLAYQWQHSGTNLAGAVTSTLTLTNINTLQSGSYRLILTNAYGAVTSSVVSLTVNLLSSALNLVSSTNPAGYKTSLNFTASVLPGGATGTVQFFTNGAAFNLQTLAAGAATSASLSTLPRGTNLIAAIYSGDLQYQPATNALAQVVTNHPPQALSVNVPLLAGLTLSIPVASLATNWSDVDGDIITLSAVAPSTNGVIVANALPALFYANSNYVNDRFVCTLSDGYGGTNYQTVNIVIVPVTNSTPVIASISRAIAGRVTLSLRGGSGSTYLLESKTNFMSGAWTPLTTNSPDLSGVWSFTDLSPTNTPAQFYRLRLLP